MSDAVLRSIPHELASFRIRSVVTRSVRQTSSTYMASRVSGSFSWTPAKEIRTRSSAPSGTVLRFEISAASFDPVRHGVRILRMSFSEDDGE
ncbi:MAG: hypothetical protein ACLP9C_01340 [Acidimicrobiales bacterium]